MIRIHSILHGSRVNGPELRSVIWTQGCSLKCPGCWNPATHSFDAGIEYDPLELAKKILQDAEVGTKGITISGGEPMHQPLSVYHLIYQIKLRRPDWSAGIFTGYDLRELVNGEYEVREEIANVAPDEEVDPRPVMWHFLRRQLDFAICGRFDVTKPVDPALDTTLYARTDARLISSSNQHVELLTSRYSHADFPPLSVEVSVEEGGLVEITGFPLSPLKSK